MIAAVSAAYWGVSLTDIELEVGASVDGLPDCDRLFLEESVLTSEAVFECEIRNTVDIIKAIQFSFSAG